MLPSVLVKITFICALLKASASSDITDKDDIVVNTKLGRVKGSFMKSRQGKSIFAFRGLHYAEPPIGEQRFRDSIPVKPWRNIKDLSEEGPACTQRDGINVSEDCLTLNIYTSTLQSPATTIRKKNPVIVFIHAGAYTTYSSQSFMYGPRYLLDHDVVLVTINYRLGFFGFINTGDEYSSGNYAFKDQILALRFVRDNIEAFGGDPNSVTLTGQSSGSRSIILHMTSPLSKGLFHRAIAMSGSPIIPIPPQKEQLGLVSKLARILNCTAEPRKELFDCLRKAPEESYRNMKEFFQEWYTAPFLVWQPAIEPEIPGIHRFLVEDPTKSFKRGKVNSVPLIIGFTKDEFFYKVSEGVNETMRGDNTFFKELNDRWYELAPINFGYERGTERSKYISREIYKFYFGDEQISIDNYKTLGELYANSIVHYPVYKAANLIADSSSSPVYLYNFTYQGRYTKHPSAGVAHEDDLQYIFNIDNDIYTGQEFPHFNEYDPEIKVVKRLSTMWAHFAHTGVPFTKQQQPFMNISPWVTYDSGNKNLLNMGEEWKMEYNVFNERMKFWENLFP